MATTMMAGRMSSVEEVSDYREEPIGLRADLGPEQLLGLIHRKDHCRGRPDTVYEAVHRRALRLPSQPRTSPGVADAGLDHAKARFIQAQRGS